MVLSRIWLTWDSYLSGEHSQRPKRCLTFCKLPGLLVAGRSSASLYVELVGYYAAPVDEVLVDVSSRWRWNLEGFGMVPVETRGSDNSTVSLSLVPLQVGKVSHLWLHVQSRCKYQPLRRVFYPSQRRTVNRTLSKSGSHALPALGFRGAKA